MPHIYKISNTYDKKVYIGQTSQTPPVHRWKEHLALARNGGEGYLYNAMRKHGIEKFKWEILEEVSPEKKNQKEIDYIAEYDSHNMGYNMTDGGEGGTLGMRRERGAVHPQAKAVDCYTNDEENPVFLYRYPSLGDALWQVCRGTKKSGKKRALLFALNGDYFQAYGHRWAWAGEPLPTPKVKKKFTGPVYAYNAKEDRLRFFKNEREAYRYLCPDPVNKDTGKYNKSTLISACRRHNDKPGTKKRASYGWYIFGNKELCQSKNYEFAKMGRPRKKSQ